MKCPNCKNRVSDLDNVCPVCGISIYNTETKRLDKQLKEEQKSSASINIIKKIIIGIYLLGAFALWIINLKYLIIIELSCAILTWIILTIEEKKIDLLQEISEKLNK